MGHSQKEANKILKKLQGVASTLHLDIADGQFVPNKSLWFPLKFSRKFKYNAHLMIKNPLGWIKKYGHKVDICIVHPESLDNIEKYIRGTKKKKKKVAFALKPETKIDLIHLYLHDIDIVLVLSVHPGFYGARFLWGPLRKVRKLRKLHPKLKILVDGHMNPRTIKKAKKAGADWFVVGSFIQKADNPKKAMKELRKALN